LFCYLDKTNLCVLFDLKVFVQQNRSLRFKKCIIYDQNINIARTIVIVSHDWSIGNAFTYYNANHHHQIYIFVYVIQNVWTIEKPTIILARGSMVLYSTHDWIATERAFIWTNLSQWFTM